jgi:hypothetical protein
VPKAAACPEARTGAEDDDADGGRDGDGDGEEVASDDAA